VNTLKTAVVVIVLLGVGYGVWMVVSKQTTPAEMPAEVAEAAQYLLAPPQCDMGMADSAVEAPGVFPPDGAPEFPPEFANQFAQAQGGPGASSPPNAAIGMPADASAPTDPFPARREMPGPEAGDNGAIASNAEIAMLPRDDAGFGATAAAPADRGFAEQSNYELPDDGRAATAGGGLVSHVATLSSAFDSDWQLALRQLEQGKLASALENLTVWQGSPDLSDEEDARLQELLDQLAGTVIYSGQHLIKPAHEVKVHERLEDIAEQYHVPAQLLANINGITNPDTLLPGQRLKVVPGPFTLRVDTRRQQIVMYARNYYAGRIFFTPGTDQPPRAGDYEVITKMVERTWYDTNGREVPPRHPENPYGQFWIGLGSDQCIHGLASDMPRGCIGLTPRDAQDLYAILGVGSEVKIR